MMPQLNLYVPDDIADTLRARARAKHLSVSQYLAEIVKRDLGKGWPNNFFEDVVGQWEGNLKRPVQEKFTRREKF